MSPDLARVLAWVVILVLWAALLYLALRLWKKGGQIRKAMAGFIATIVVILMIDSGIGLFVRTEASVEIVVENATDAPNRTIMAIPGYNGHGIHLVSALAPGLEGEGALVSFEYGTEAYDNEKVIGAIEQAIQDHVADELVIECESYGCMVVAEVLRRNPDLRLKGLVLNAAPSSASDVKLLGDWLKVASLLPDSKLLTYAMQWWERRQQGTPWPEDGVDPKDVQAAYDAAAQLTSPLVLGQLRTMAYFEPPSSGEFAGRVDNVRFVHAPDPSGEGDALIHLQQASAAWEAAFTNADSDSFEDVTIESWSVGAHTPTSGHPSGLVEQIKATYA